MMTEGPWTEIKIVDTLVREIRDRVQVKLPGFGLPPSRAHLQYVSLLIIWTVADTHDRWFQPAPMPEDRGIAHDREAVAAYFEAECDHLQNVIAMLQSHPWWRETVGQALQAGALMAPDVDAVIRKLVVDMFQAPDGFPFAQSADGRR